MSAKRNKFLRIGLGESFQGPPGRDTNFCSRLSTCWTEFVSNAPAIGQGPEPFTSVNSIFLGLAGCPGFKLCITAPSEAIAAPQVWCRHCHASYPFPGATKGGTFTGAGQSYRRDLCRHIGCRPSSNRQPRMLVSQTDPFLRSQPAGPYFHASWCATGA